MTPDEHLKQAEKEMRIAGSLGWDKELNLLSGQLHALLAIAQILKEGNGNR